MKKSIYAVLAILTVSMMSFTSAPVTKDVANFDSQNKLTMEVVNKLSSEEIQQIDLNIKAINANYQVEVCSSWQQNQPGGRLYNRSCTTCNVFYCVTCQQTGTYVNGSMALVEETCMSD